MNKNIVFSIIIPHKNTPDLLQRCLISIPRRDDIQIIVVDDNSSASKVDFEHFPGLNDPYINVIFTKEGKGAGYARNVGLTHAKGEWLLFADADDFFLEDAFEHLFAEINSPHEIIYFKVKSCYSDSYKQANRGDNANCLIDDFIIKAKNADQWLRYKYSVPWGKMIKAELVRKNNIWFDEVVAANDGMFSLISAYFASSINVNDHIIYCVTVTIGSINNTINLESLTSRYTVGLRYNKFLRDHKCNKFQTYVVTYYLFYSIKYGLRVFYKFLKLAFYYGLNPFFGVSQWLKRYSVHRLRMKNAKKYILHC